MSKAYLGDDNNTGLQILHDQALEALVLEAHTKGYQLACHATGDAAIGQLITAYEKALAFYPMLIGGIASNIAVSRSQSSTHA